MSKKRGKKIAVQKHDEPSFVIEQLLDTESDLLVFSIPKGAKFSDSVSNFRLLKKQGELLGKEIRIESVDDDALAMAEEAGISAKNPFFGRMKAAQMSDIVVPVKRAPAKASKRVAVTVDDEDDTDTVEEEVEPELEEAPTVLHAHDEGAEEEFIHELDTAMHSDKKFEEHHKHDEAEYEEEMHRVKRYSTSALESSHGAPLLGL